MNETKMNSTQFQLWLNAGFFSWASSNNTTKLQWLMSLQEFADREFNKEYNKTYSV